MSKNSTPPTVHVTVPDENRIKMEALLNVTLALRDVIRALESAQANIWINASKISSSSTGTAVHVDNVSANVHVDAKEISQHD